MNRGSGLALRGCGRRAATGCSRTWRGAWAAGPGRRGAGRTGPSARWWSGARTTIWAWGITRRCWTGPARRCARYGAGAGGTRNIAGTTRLHVELEAGLAQLHGKPAALLFTSGYVANEAAIGTLARLLPGCLILSDANNHASMIAGVRAAGCEKQIFRHNDLAHLEQLLAAAPRERPKLVAFEGVYSMDGDFGPVAEVCALARALRGADLSRRGARGRHVRRHAAPGSRSAIA